MRWRSKPLTGDSDDPGTGPLDTGFNVTWSIDEGGGNTEPLSDHFEVKYMDENGVTLTSSDENGNIESYGTVTIRFINMEDTEVTVNNEAITLDSTGSYTITVDPDSEVKNYIIETMDSI